MFFRATAWCVVLGSALTACHSGAFRADSLGVSCVERLNSSMGVHRDEFVAALSPEELKCLYEETVGTPPIDPSFFVGPTPSPTSPVSHFFGANSLSVGHTFEKHFVPDGEGGVWGYNVSFWGGVLSSPGLFRVLDDRPGVLDYTPDFVTWVSAERLSAAKEHPGFALSRVANNTGNLIFDRLEDTLHRVSDDLAVGRAERVNPDGTREHLSYFAIVRQPTP